MMCMAAVTSYGGLITTRVLLGLMEGAHCSNFLRLFSFNVLTSFAHSPRRLLHLFDIHVELLV